MIESYTLKGKIVSGARQAAFFTQLDWVQEQLEEKFGFRPFPGTLNLEVDGEFSGVIETLQKKKLVKLLPPDPEFCIAKTISATIGGIEGVVIIPEDKVNIHAANIIEVMAPVKLKEALGVKDGDRLELSIKIPAA